MPYCGNQWVPAGTVCPDGSTPVKSRGGVESPAPGAVQTNTGRPPATQPQGIPPQADRSPVVTSRKPPRPGLEPETYMVSDVYTERQNLNRLRVTNPGYYNRIVSELRATGLLGPRATSESSIDNAYNKLLKAASGAAAEGMPVTPQEARNIIAGVDEETGGPTGGRTTSGRGGRAAAYDGPVVSENVSQYSEGDIARLATDIGLELLGRQPTEQELNRINKRVRAAEMATPAVTTQEQVAPGKTRTVTEAGLAQSDREQIMREVLQQNPEFEQYQMNTTVLDTILSTIRKDRAALYG